MKIKIRKITFVILAGLCVSVCFGQKKTPAYLCAFMDGKSEDLRYCTSADGFHFTEVNGGNTVLTSTIGGRIIRDPHILKDNNGVYHLIATNAWSGRSFAIWDSKDLINWQNERLVTVSSDSADKTWAPEAIYNEKDKNYLFYWTSSLHNEAHSWAIYYATTTDFKTFSKPAILMQSDQIILDANIVKYDVNRYVMFYRYKNQIWKKDADALVGNYKDSALVINANVEGPFVYKTGNSSWNMIWDYYGGNQGRYGMAQTSDLKQWNWLTDANYPYYNDKVSFPQGVRHGSVIAISLKELNNIKKEFDKK